jgi:phosphoglycolate phosphatase
LAKDESLELFAGTRELLQWLGEQGKHLAIATGKSHAGLQRALSASGLGAFFVATRCADQTEPKPHPAMLRELMEELDIEAHRTLMIGDTSHDLQMAAAAGTAAVGVTYGAHSRAQLVPYAPLALVDSMTDLRRWLGQP